MKRRDFIAIAGAAALTGPFDARAQSDERPRRIGVLEGLSVTEGAKEQLTVFETRLKELGWASGRNIKIDVRWWDGSPAQLQSNAVDLMSIAPDVVVPVANSAVAAIKPMLGNVPAVFVAVGDPVGNGFVASLARPGGTMTGFLSYEAAMATKWLEVLHEATPGVRRVLAIFYSPEAFQETMWHAVENAAPQLEIQAIAGGVDDANNLASVIADFASEPDGGLLVLPSAIANTHSDLVVALAARYRLPAVYYSRPYVAVHGGLVAYAIDFNDSWRQTADYVDRILRGAKPGELPVQGPTKFQLIINLKTAKALDLTIPPMLLARADEVIE